MENIVVGIDGSEGSVAALKWAAEEAKLRKAHLRVVTAWEFPYAYGGMEGMVLPFDQIEADAKALLDATIEKAIVDPVLRSSLERICRSGNASGILQEESAKADLLVVGARGHGGFMGLLLGSTSDQIVKHAACPVVVVRNPQSA